MARIAAATVAMAALAVAGVAERAAVAASFAVLGHLHWLWIPAAVLLESASMAAFAIMLRRLLAAGGARVGVRPMLATAYAANAVSVSVPLAGPALATAFTFRRFTRQGADAAAGRLVAAGRRGDLLGRGGSGHRRRRAGVREHPGHRGRRSRRRARHSRPRRGAERPRGGRGCAARSSGQPRGRCSEDPGCCAGPPPSPARSSGPGPTAWAHSSFPPSGWLTVTGLALANWLADAAVLAVSIRATGAAVPWHDLLLVYGTGIAAQSLNITPGGLGVTEGTLSLALVATGLGASRALAAVLLYRLASFWLVAFAGWLVLLWLRRPRARARSRNYAVPRPCRPADRAAC